jgi:hypothetical protein
MGLLLNLLQLKTTSLACLSAMLTEQSKVFGRFVHTRISNSQLCRMLSSLQDLLVSSAQDLRDRRRTIASTSILASVLIHIHRKAFYGFKASVYGMEIWRTNKMARDGHDLTP